MSASHAGGASPQFDAHGHAAKAGAAAAAPHAAATATATACLEMFGPSGVLFKIDITFDTSVYPYNITGGTIKGSICGAPAWSVLSGHLGANLQLHGKFTGSGSCASTIDIVGNYQNPSSYAGTYGFNGANNIWKQTTLYCCGPCPP